MTNHMTGSLSVSLESVVSLVSAADMLCLDWVLQQCQQFLLDNLHHDNIVTAARLANIYRLVILITLYSTVSSLLAIV